MHRRKIKLAEGKAKEHNDKHNEDRPIGLQSG
jgi:hypothetical protein